MNSGYPSALRFWGGFGLEIFAVKVAGCTKKVKILGFGRAVDRNFTEFGVTNSQLFIASKACDFMVQSEIVHNSDLLEPLQIAWTINRGGTSSNMIPNPNMGV